MKDFEIIDSLFNKEESKKYDLSIQLMPDGFSFSIIDSTAKTLLVLKSKGIDETEDILPDDYYCQYMYDFIVNDDLLKLEYNHIKLIYFTRLYTHIPESVFDKEKITSLFAKTIDLPESHQIIENKVSLIDAIVVFSIPDCIYRVINRLFSNITFTHQSTDIINYSSKNSDNSMPTVYIFQDVNEFDILFLKGGKLLAYNTFEYKTSDDIVYHLFNLIDQHSSGVKVEKIVLSGRVRIFKEFIPNLKKFFSKLNFIKPEESLQISSFFNNIQLQDYNLLFLPGK